MDVAIDITVSNKPVESALSIVLKAMDVEADKKSSSIVPSLWDNARTLFDYYKTYGVYILECQTIGDINDMLLNILTSLAKIKPILVGIKPIPNHAPSKSLQYWKGPHHLPLLLLSRVLSGMNLLPAETWAKSGRISERPYAQLPPRAPSQAFPL